MKIIKILLFFAIFLNFYSVLAINSIPIGYWGSNFNKNIDNNIIYELPVGFFGNNITYTGSNTNNILYNSKVGYIGTNFNKKLTYTGILYQTPVGYFSIYKDKKVIFPKLTKINYVLNNTLSTLTNNTGESITNTGNIIFDKIKLYDNIHDTGSIINNGNNTGSINIGNNNNLNDIISNNTGSIIIKKSKEQIKQDELNKLKEKIKIAQDNKNIYTYRKREYIKNSDGSFTNVDTLNPYTGNIDNLKKKVYITPKVENISTTNKNNTKIENILYSLSGGTIDNTGVINDNFNKNIIQDNNNSIQNNSNISNNNENTNTLRSNSINNNNNNNNTSSSSNLYNNNQNNTLNEKVSVEVKRQIRENEINKLKERISIAQNNRNIYTYRLREYIKNSDGSFTNIDTLNPYTGNINNLKKKVYNTYNNSNTLKDNNNNNNNNSSSNSNSNYNDNNYNLNNGLSKEQIKKNELDKLKERISVAQDNKNIYTYHLREYIKNLDGSFTNVATLNPYTGNINNLKKKVYSISKDNINSNNKIYNNGNLNNLDSKNYNSNPNNTNKININQKEFNNNPNFNQNNFDTNQNIYNYNNNFLKNNLGKKSYLLSGNLSENINNYVKINRGKVFNLKTKKIVEDMIYAFKVNKYLLKERNKNFKNYIMLKSCFLGENCDNKNIYLDMKYKIISSIDTKKESKKLGIILNSKKDLDYKEILKITFKIFGSDGFYKLKETKSKYGYNVIKLISKILKTSGKPYTNISFLSYERIYLSLIESTDFTNNLEKILFKK